MNRIAVLCALVCCVLLACKKNESENPEVKDPTGTLKLKFETVAGDDEFFLNQEYVNANGDTFSVSNLDYYVSNVKLIDEDSNIIALDDSYYLIETTGTTNTLEVEIEDLPTGHYQNLIVHLGVDSAANHSFESEAGDLDPAGTNGMIWTWATGYKFLKLDGTWRNGPNNGSLTFHVGTDDTYSIFNFTNNEADTSGHNHMRVESDSPILMIQENKTTTAHLTFDVLELFMSPNTFDFNVTNDLASPSSDFSPIVHNWNMSMDEFKNGAFQLHHVAIE